MQFGIKCFAIIIEVSALQGLESKGGIRVENNTKRLLEVKDLQVSFDTYAGEIQAVEVLISIYIRVRPLL